MVRAKKKETGTHSVCKKNCLKFNVLDHDRLTNELEKQVVLSAFSLLKSVLAFRNLLLCKLGLAL